MSLTRSQRSRYTSTNGFIVTHHVWQQFATVRHAVERNDAGFDLHANLVDYGELETAKALARHFVEICWPKHYAPDNVVPEGSLCIVRDKARNLQIWKKNAILIVKFVSPPSFKDVHTQLFCTSLEPNTKKGQGAGLSTEQHSKQQHLLRKHSLTLACETSRARTPRVTWSRLSTACLVAHFSTHCTRHPMPSTSEPCCKRILLDAESGHTTQCLYQSNWHLAGIHSERNYYLEMATMARCIFFIASRIRQRSSLCVSPPQTLLCYAICGKTRSLAH